MKISSHRTVLSRPRIFNFTASDLASDNFRATYSQVFVRTYTYSEFRKDAPSEPAGCAVTASRSSLFTAISSTAASQEVSEIIRPDQWISAQGTNEQVWISYRVSRSSHRMMFNRQSFACILTTIWVFSTGNSLRRLRYLHVSPGI